MLLKFRWPAAVATAFAGLLAFQGGAAADKEPAKRTASKLDLAPESFSKLFALVRPQATEWRHLRVQWTTDVVAARRRAATDDKPIVVLYTGGAGYNEPLGIC